MKTGIHSSLRQVIRNLILETACNGATAKIQQGLDEIERLNLNVEVKQQGARGYDVILRDGTQIVGLFQVSTPPDYCKSTYVTEWTEVDSSLENTGIGAVLYDVAIEYATKLGSYLTCDRLSVSDEAKRMWRYYNRSDDYEVLQLDTESGQFTPDKWDDCRQETFHKEWYREPIGSKSYREEFIASPFTKAYRKKRTTTIPCLGDRYIESE